MSDQKFTHHVLQFFRAEAFGGILLIFASIVALLLANSPWSLWYHHLISAELHVGIGEWMLKKTLLLWINDGLMAIFFLLIGLEVKREMIEGQLAKISQVILPGAAALGGIIFPALIYLCFNHDEGLATKGWAIPTATDIAFAIGILALLGKRVPISLKMFLLAIAIFDDLAAIIIIALFYTTELSFISLLLAAMAIILLIICNYANIRYLSIYVVIGMFLWLFVLKSGVHATLAGVVLAFTIPSKHPQLAISLAKDLEKALHGWVSFFILPIFAFANAGINFSETTQNDFLSPLTLGIALGLFLGKQLGIFIPTFLLIKSKLVTMPQGSNWKQIYGIGVFCGIGFTMSLFISTLAFENEGAYIINSRLGIFIGTIFSALIGYFILFYASSSETS